MASELVNPDLIIVFATTSCSDCRLATSVLDDAGVQYRLVDLDRSPEAVEMVLELNGGYRTVPTIVFPDGRVLVEPNRRELLIALGRPL